MRIYFTLIDRLGYISLYFHCYYLYTSEAASGRSHDDREPNMVIRQFSSCICEEGIVEADITTIHHHGYVPVYSPIIFIRRQPVATQEKIPEIFQQNIEQLIGETCSVAGLCVVPPDCPVITVFSQPPIYCCRPL